MPVCYSVLFSYAMKCNRMISPVKKIKQGKGQENGEKRILF